MPIDYPRRSPAFLKLRVAVRPFITSEQITIGLSGGADSLGLVAAAVAEGANVHAVVVDHQLQSDSAGVAKQAAQLAEQWGAHTSVVSVTVPSSGGMEAAARRVRYAALQDFGAPVWVGHTMDDQAETYLLGGVRGNPVGMLPTSIMGGVPLVRPLLTVRRADTLGACAELGISPWHDPHNSDSSYRRVRMRTQIIPQLNDAIEGDAVPALAQAATRAALNAACVEEFARPEATVPELKLMDPAVRQASIAALIVREGCSVSYSTVVAIEQLVIAWTGQGPVAIGGTNGGRVWVRRVGEKLQVLRD